MTWRVLGVATSTHYESLARPPSARTLADAELTATIAAVYAQRHRRGPRPGLVHRHSPACGRCPSKHHAADGWVYCCAVVDVFSRKVVGWSIADRGMITTPKPSGNRVGSLSVDAGFARSAAFAAVETDPVA